MVITLPKFNVSTVPIKHSQLAKEPCSKSILGGHWANEYFTVNNSNKMLIRKYFIKAGLGVSFGSSSSNKVIIFNSGHALLIFYFYSA